ncbi:MAG: ATP-binding protein [Novosphingobium sp.]
MERAQLHFGLRSLFVGGSLLMVVGLLALASAVLWLEASNRQFAARVDMARQQMQLVSRIETEAALAFLQEGRPKAAAGVRLDRAARNYLDSIENEARLLGDGPDQIDWQASEETTGRRLLDAIHALDGVNGLDRVRAIAGGIAMQEHREVEVAVAAAARVADLTWWLVCVIMSGLLGLPIACAALLWHNLVKPLEALVRATNDLASGGVTRPLPLEGLNETRRLTEHFNEMAEAVEARVAQRTMQLRQANDQLARTDQRRRLFLSKVSHELRTPVTVMRGETEVALRFAEGEEALREALRHVLDSNLFLQRRLDDLLTLARAEDGALPLHRGEVDLACIARHAGRTSAAFAAASGICVDVAGLDAAMPVIGDEERLCQALVALIDNGVKFSPPGGTVRLRSACIPGGYGIAVSDEGPGVEPGDLDRIFDPYVQGDAGRALGGTGLGLSLARWIVHEHNGTILAANKHKGEGLCVSLMLPVAA